MSDGRIMIVEDEPLVADAIEINLESFGYEVVAKASRAEEAIRIAKQLSPDIILMDIMLAGDMDGIVAAQKIQDESGIPIVYLTAYDDEQTLQRASITEPFGYVLKPFSPRELNAIIAMALYKARSEKKLLEGACSTEVFNHLSDAVLGLDAQYSVLMINQPALKLLGFNENEAVNQPWDKLIRCNEPEQQLLLNRLVSKRKNPLFGSKPHSVDLNTEHAVLSVDISICPVLKQGSLISTVLILRDVTERKNNELRLKQYQDHLEELVQERTQELYYINQELDAYNYSVSHDLRSPLRAIKGFSQILKEDYASVLDEKAKNYLQRISSASHRMGELIDDLLMLSRISLDELVRDSVNISHLCRELTSSFQEKNPERQFEIIIHDGMQANADERLLRLLFENLIDNAAKFSANNKVTLIEIGMLTDHRQPTYFVRDAGVGFDMKYADKLFRVFQRLHSVQQFEGGGVGLATCQRIVGKHYGEIWAESKPGKGTSIYFTLTQNAYQQKQA